MIVSKSPYTIERCDATVALDAEFIPDQNDYTARKPAYVTISAYHLNVFESKDPASLEGSILFSNSKNAPI